MRRILALFLPLIDLLLVPVTAAAALLMRTIRRRGIERLPKTLWVFRRIGVFPLLDHYYEPLFNPAHLRKSLSDDRELPGVDWNVGEQLALLKQFHFNEELTALPREHRAELEYFYNNDAFASGDAEFLYNMIRLHKPRRIIEIGSGSSTLLAAKAIQFNRADEPEYTCEHVCIEPYEADWLETLGVTTIREPVESLDLALFRSLERNDILFIDSSHMIRPQGDVVVEYLEILPILQSGVLIHVHDIFSPKDYLDDWIRESVHFWNEQYLLEAFLSFNTEFKVIGALNFLKHRYPLELASCCPVLGDQMDSREPGSFWIRRV
ncbi:class I SAM-dependent methyltransferase [soil metagenome]